MDHDSARVIVITGVHGGLGQVVARTAAAQGWRVGGIDRGPASTNPDAARMDRGDVDLVAPAQAKAAIDAIHAHFGAVDALVNIAGGFASEPVSGDPAAWEQMHHMNLLTALNASRAAIPYLEASAAGRIVNIGALGALKAAAGMGAYAASKAGVHRLTEALAAELKGRVTVNAVLPSTIDTAANRAAMPDADFAKWVTPAELAEVILFLAGASASGITGALIPVAGRF